MPIRSESAAFPQIDRQALRPLIGGKDRSPILRFAELAGGGEAVDDGGAEVEGDEAVLVDLDIGEADAVF